ncbi:MAG: bifunctional oligoribonuclease/PAP phosphatase NrnA [Erysipelotrichaceae bacterium]|nr:bifunctional oligoribonuclease/PAP phosphatase NrnA [Erysipelotrichaceae bacterium]
MIEQFFSLVEQFDTIAIYRHINADCDALGSQFGMKTWIQEKYPHKKVYALGKSLGSSAKLFPAIDEVEDEELISSLAIVLDTPNSKRIDDERWKLAKYKIKIDHHVFVETFADLEFVEETAGATCEIVAKIFQQHNEQLPPVCARYLYSGIISDTLQFSIPTTSYQTMQVASYLLSFGIDIASVNREHFSRSYKEFQYEAYLQQHVTFQDGVAYIKVGEEDYKQFGLTLKEAKEKVYALGSVHEFEIWALFVENPENEQGEILYNGSLRSQRVTINDIANQYHGGGHRLACGVRGLTSQEVDQLIHDLQERIKSELTV